MNLIEVIKNNGEVVPFDLGKLVAKAKWAIADSDSSLNWATTVLSAVEGITEKTISTKKLDRRLIDQLVSEATWEANLAAGRIYLSTLRKSMWWYKGRDKSSGDFHFPTVLEMHRHLQSLKLMKELPYSDEEYAQIESFVDHTKDTSLAYFQIKQIYSKYGIKNVITDEKYELPQYVYIRMAMAANEYQPESVRLQKVRTSYEELRNTVTAPTPDYTYLGTPHAGFASCCLYASSDDRRSMAVGKHIAYTMTYMAAGIGNNVMCRSLEDPVRGGSIRHMGKEPYYYSMGGDVTENKQGARSGACTTYYPITDPDFRTLAMLQSHKTNPANQNRVIHFAVVDHPWYAKKVITDEDYIPFNPYTAPKLNELFYGKDIAAFEAEYDRWSVENQHRVKQSARSNVALFMQQRYEVGTFYQFNVAETNIHTPFLDPIHSSNLCTEVMGPTKPYHSILDLYSEEDHGRGEVAMCNLASLALPELIKIIDGEMVIDHERYRRAARVALELVDYTIDHAHYELPHIGVTAKARRSAGVGMIGMATLMAQAGLKYDTLEGRNFAHKVSETHYWHLINVSIEMGEELGVAKWMHKTKWPQGYLPIDSYNRNVDELITVGNLYDWESLRPRLIKNGGMRFSVLATIQPTESSSKSTYYPNSVLPIRELVLRKTDGDNMVEWVAFQNTQLADKYQFAWDVDPIELLKYYAVHQKWLDNGGSFDTYRDRRRKVDLSKRSLITEYATFHRYGLKSVYYANSITTSQTQRGEGAGDCASGACKG